MKLFRSSDEKLDKRVITVEKHVSVKKIKNYIAMTISLGGGECLKSKADALARL